MQLYSAEMELALLRKHSWVWIAEKGHLHLNALLTVLGDCEVSKAVSVTRLFIVILTYSWKCSLQLWWELWFFVFETFAFWVWRAPTVWCCLACIYFPSSVPKRINVLKYVLCSLTINNIHRAPFIQRLQRKVLHTIKENFLSGRGLPLPRFHRAALQTADLHRLQLSFCVLLFTWLTAITRDAISRKEMLQKTNTMSATCWLIGGKTGIYIGSLVLCCYHMLTQFSSPGNNKQDSHLDKSVIFAALIKPCTF